MQSVQSGAIEAQHKQLEDDAKEAAASKESEGDITGQFKDMILKLLLDQE